LFKKARTSALFEPRPPGWESGDQTIPRSPVHPGGRAESEGVGSAQISRLSRWAVSESSSPWAIRQLMVSTVDPTWSARTLCIPPGKSRGGTHFIEQTRDQTNWSRLRHLRLSLWLAALICLSPGGRRPSRLLQPSLIRNWDLIEPVLPPILETKWTRCGTTSGGQGRFCATLLRLPSEPVVDSRAHPHGPSAATLRANPQR
jgi:hypothetical protein